MSVEILTYAALGARLNISPKAARSLTRRLRLPRALSDGGKALVSVNFANTAYVPATTEWAEQECLTSSKD